MKKQALIFLFIISICCVLPSSAYAQLDVTTQLTTKHIIPPFVSDGQTYRAMVLSGQNAEFHATFFQEQRIALLQQVVQPMETFYFQFILIKLTLASVN